jgi:AcrR family transcriptional regulator
VSPRRGGAQLPVAPPPIDADRPPPPPRELGPRADDIVAAARRILEDDGPDALTMRRLAAALDVKAPSLYKHLAGKGAIEVVLIEQGFTELGVALRAAVHGRTPADALRPLLATYRATALANPNLYRLVTSGVLPRDHLVPGLEDWAGEPFGLVVADPDVGRALWSAAHGMAILELDGRYPPDADLDLTWACTADAFAATLT